MLKQFFTAIAIGSFTRFTTAGQVATDGSMGAAQTLTGPNYTISQDLGTTVGNNLFHSFGTFNLSQGDVATFTGADTIQNVISHVTDGNPSSIDGTIQSQVGDANFFFINPAGIVFGQHAAIDVPAAFHASTANELRFADGTTYNLVTTKGSLTAAPPESFGFLGKTGDIIIEGGQLKFKDGTDVSFTGGSVTSNNATIEVPRGSLRVYGQGDTVGNVPINGKLPTGNGVVTVNGGLWETSGDGAGAIEISGGIINVINYAKIYNGNTGNQDSIDIIHIEANTLLIGSGAQIAAWADANGKAGDVIISVIGGMQILNGGTIASGTLSQGNAGNITVTANSLIIDGHGSQGVINGHESHGYTMISSVAGPGSSGSVGVVTITVNGEIQMLNRGTIGSSTFGNGNAGSTVVTAESLIIDGQGAQYGDTGIASVAFDSTGNAGSIVVKISGEIKLLNAGVISSGTLAQGDGGDVTVFAGSLLIDGRGMKYTGINSQAHIGAMGSAGTINVFVAGNVTILNNGVISNANFGTGDAGAITITIGGRINVVNGFIMTSAQTGNGGPITITAPAIVLNNSQITTSVEGAGGNGGDIALNGGYLVLSTGFIQANTTGENAKGGNIFINMDGLLPNGGVTNVGGQTRETFVPNSGKNVIQAAAPGGESGTITFNDLDYDTASKIATNSNRLEQIKLAKHPCEGMKHRARFRRKGEVGLPNSGEDVMQFKRSVKNRDAGLSKQLRGQAVCEAKL